MLAAVTNQSHQAEDPAIADCRPAKLEGKRHKQKKRERKG